MKSPVILNKVKDDLGLRETADELKNKMTVVSENESQIVSISATDKDYSKVPPSQIQSLPFFKETFKTS